jgi:hypothetical protein
MESRTSESPSLLPQPPQPLQQQPPPPPPPRSSSASRLNLKDTIKNHMANVQLISEQAVDRASRLVRLDMLAQTEDYKLLETLNHIARDRFAEMGDADGVLGVVLRTEAEELKNLREFFDSHRRAIYGTDSDIDEDIAPYVHQVSELEKQVAAIEALTAELDDYTSRLEAAVRKRVGVAGSRFL